MCGQARPLDGHRVMSHCIDNQVQAATAHPQDRTTMMMIMTLVTAAIVSQFNYKCQLITIMPQLCCATGWSAPLVASGANLILSPPLTTLLSAVKRCNRDFSTILTRVVGLCLEPKTIEVEARKICLGCQGSGPRLSDFF